MASTRCQAALITSIALLAMPAVSAAQSDRRHVEVSVAVQSYAVSADEVDGTLTAAGVGAILPINLMLDFEVEFLRPTGTVRRQYTGVAFSLAPLGSTREEIERDGVVTRTTHERRLDGVLSFGASFHPRRNGSRLQPRGFVGVTTHFARNRSLREPLQWPPTVTLERILQMQPPIEQHRRALGSLTLGAGLAVTVTSHLVVTPELRYDYGSIGDEINNSWRAGTRVAWRF